MEEFRTRPFADDDSAAVADLLNASEAAHGGEPGFTAGEIRGFAGMLLGDAGGDSRLYVAADGTLAAVAFIGAPPPGGAKPPAQHEHVTERHGFGVAASARRTLGFVESPGLDELSHWRFARPHNSLAGHRVRQQREQEPRGAGDRHR